MYFKNEAHKTAFVRAAKKANQKDRRLMCKLYLLTADRALWRAAKRESNGGKYPLGRIRTLSTVVAPRQDLTFTQLRIYYEENGFDTSGEYFYRNLGMYTTDGKLNYFAMLLSDQSDVTIKVARFKGTDKVEIITNKEFGYCCILKSVYNVLDYLDNFNMPAVKITYPKRVEKYLIDKTALREAVINAIVHNDYVRGGSPLFEIYDDRINIVSYGGLVGGLTEEEFFSGCSMPRNRELMRVFRDMELVENFGSGMHRILQAYDGIEWLPYEWKLVQDYNCFELIAECLLLKNGSSILKDYITNQSQEGMWTKLPIGKAKLISEMVIACGKNGQVQISKYLTVLGQSIYVKEYRRIEKRRLEKIESCKLNLPKIKKLFSEDSDYDIAISKLVEIIEMKNAGNTLQEISCKVSLNEEIIKKLISSISF